MKWSLLLFGLVAVAGTAAACEGLSPGDQIQTEDGLCTLGFLVADPNGIYFTTAGHCVDVDQSVSSPDHPDFGVGVFHFLEPETGSTSDGKPGFDFGLIRVDPGVYTSLNPKMCGWPGPTGVYREAPGSGGVKLFGHGLLFGDLGPTTQKREGLFLRNDGDAFYFTGAGVPGDSGSAVLSDDGRALGVLTHVQANVSGPGETNGGTHLDRGFYLAAEAGFTQLRLVLLGEDPIAVLRELQNAPPPPAEPTPSPTPAPTTPTSRPSPSPSRDPPPPTSNEPERNDSIAPAATVGDDPAPTPEAPRDTPLPALVALLALVVAAARRKR